MDRIRTVATFVAGVLVGGSAVYFSPPEAGPAATTMPGGAPRDGTLPPPVTVGVPGTGGIPGAGTADGIPLGPPPENGGLPPGSVPGTPGALPGTPGSVPGTPGAVGAVPGTPGEVPPGDVPPGTAPGVPVAGSAVPGQNPIVPPAATEDEVPAAPPSAVQQSGSRLEKHLRIATSVWRSQAALAKASPNSAMKALAADIEAHAESVPEIGEHMPPMQEVAGYLASSRVLLDRMGAAGMDVADLSLQVDMMMRPPKGKIPGGPKSGTAPK